MINEIDSEEQKNEDVSEQASEAVYDEPIEETTEEPTDEMANEVVSNERLEKTDIKKQTAKKSSVKQSSKTDTAKSKREMNKKEFIKMLESRLSQLPRDERQKAIDYYNELYLDRFESGEEETEIIKSFGSIDEIVTRILNENAADVTVEEELYSQMPKKFVRTKAVIGNMFDKMFSLFKNKTFFTIYFSLCFITIPLTIAFFSIIFSLVVAAFSIVFSLAATVAAIYLSFFACAIAFFIAGPIYFGYGVYLLTTNLNPGFAIIGSGIVLIALGILFLLAIKVFNLLLVLAFTKKNRKDRVAKTYKHMKVKQSLIIAVVIMFMGASVFGVGFGRADWDIAKLDTTIYKDASVTLDESFTEYKISVVSREVKIVKTNDNFRVTAYDFKNSTISVTVEDGKLTVKEKFKFDLERLFNIYFDTNWKQQRIVIYVPVDAVRV